jgi:hypothetical protein
MSMELASVIVKGMDAIEIKSHFLRASMLVLPSCKQL